MTDEVTLVREHTLTTEIPLYTATATFIDGDDKPYTYHEKEVEDGTIILYSYNTDNTRTLPTSFRTHPIDDETGHYNENIPFPPQVKPESARVEETRISLETCKDFDITDRDTETLTHENWAAEVDMPRDAALAYQRHFGKDKFRIR